MSPCRVVACGMLAVTSTLVVVCTPWARAETPGQVPTPSSYESSMKMQQLEEERQRQQRALQQQQDEQRQREWEDTVRQQQARQAAAAAEAQKVLQTWQNRPALAPEKNPLIGRWDVHAAPPPGAKKTGSAGDLNAAVGPEMANLASALLGGITTGMCDSMLGRGVIEFRAGTAVAIDANGQEQVKYHAAYRGGDTRVVVLPQDATTFTHMIIDFDGHDRAVVAGPGCVLARSGSATAKAAALEVKARDQASAPAPVAAAAGSAIAPAAVVTGDAVLALKAGSSEASGQFMPIVQNQVWVLKGPVEKAMLDAGIRSTHLMRDFVLACAGSTPQCQAGMRAIAANAVSKVVTDAGGQAQTAGLPAGRYFVFSTATYKQRPMFWQVPIELHAGKNTLALDLSNARTLE